MGPRGPEKIHNNISQTIIYKEVSKNKSIHTKSQKVHNRVHNKTSSSELQEIIEQWETLPEHIKAAILALVKIEIHQNK